MKKRITIHDVCHEAGVSISTVSNVLNSRPNVGDATRKRVLHAIERLEFTPSSAARNLSRSSTETIGVVLPLFSGFYGRLMYGIQQTLGPRHLYLLSISVDEALENTFDVMKRLIDERRVDGLIVYNPILTPSQIRELQNSAIPIVAGEKPVEGPALSCVLYDNFMAGYDAARHLVDHGSKRIAALTGPCGGTARGSVCADMKPH